MIPLILISRHEDTIKHYIDNYIEKQKYASYDIFHIKPQKKELSINEIRTLQKEIKLKFSRPRLYILYQFDMASEEAQNALLKTIEEKNTNNQFIMTVSQIQKVLATIRSRSKKIIIRSLQQKTAQELNQAIEIFNLITDSTSLGFLSKTAERVKTREATLEFIEEIISVLRKKLHENEPKVSKVIEQALKVRNLIENNNLNSLLALDNLLIFIWKRYRIK